MVGRVMRARAGWTLHLTCILAFAILVTAGQTVQAAPDAEATGDRVQHDVLEGDEQLEAPRRHIMVDGDDLTTQGEGSAEEPIELALSSLDDATIIASLLDSNYCVDAPSRDEEEDEEGDGRQGPEALHMWLCHGGGNQLWHYTPQRHIVSALSRRHLDARRGVEGTIVEQQPFDPDSSAQRWEWSFDGRLRPEVNESLCLDLWGDGHRTSGAIAHATKLWLAPCSREDSQRWTPGDCMDADPACEFWASEGECASNPDFMIGVWQDDEYGGEGTFVPGSCRASCHTCAYQTDDSIEGGGFGGDADEWANTEATGFEHADGAVATGRRGRRRRGVSTPPPRPGKNSRPGAGRGRHSQQHGAGHDSSTKTDRSSSSSSGGRSDGGGYPKTPAYGYFTTAPEWRHRERAGGTVGGDEDPEHSEL